MDAIAQQYRAGDATAARHSIDQLRLPHAEAWFADYLGPEQSANLAERYDRLLANFADSLEKTIKDIVANNGSDLIADLAEDKAEVPSDGRRYGLKLSGTISVKRPSLFRCHFKIVVKKQDSTSWVDVFVHEDGAFRFLGFGIWPFWVWEDGAEGGAPIGGNYGEPYDLIIPVVQSHPFPVQARAIEGVVLRVLIDKRGRVEKADFVSGDPSLAQTALEFARHYSRYKARKVNGEPVETELSVNVVLKLRVY